MGLLEGLNQLAPVPLGFARGELCRGGGFVLGPFGKLDLVLGELEGVAQVVQVRGVHPRRSASFDTSSNLGF